MNDGPTPPSDRTAALRPRAGRVGIVDIGSNSIRLVVYEHATRSPLPVFNEKVLCALARGLDASGKLNPRGVELAYANLERFVTLAHNMRVARLDMLATSAVRDADDGPTFVAEVERRCGVPVRVISGQEEARLSGVGVLCGMPDADGVMGDLGGGSLELVALAAGATGAAVSLPIGPLRLSGDRDDAMAAIARAVDGVHWLKDVRGRRFYAVGGAWRTFARVHMERERHPLHIIHHYEIQGEDARDLARMLAGQSSKSLEKTPGVSRRRVDTLALASAVLERVLGMLRPRTVVFSAFGLREGYFYERLPLVERTREPLIAFTEDEGAGWRRFSLSPEEIYDWLSPVFAGESAEEARLRRAACHMSDIAWDDHPDYRADMAYRRVLHLPAPGLTHRDRAILALAMAHRYESEPNQDLVQAAERLAEPKGRAYARRLGSCLRLAYNVSGGAPGLLTRISLTRSERTLRLRAPAALRRQLGDAVERRLETAADAFDIKGEIDVRD